MKMSTFLRGPSAAPRQPGQLHPTRRAMASAGLDNPALTGPWAVTPEASTEPWADHSRGLASTIARWWRRALTDAARAWALAAGVPPDLYH